MKSPDSPLRTPPNGFEMYICAVAFDAVFIGALYEEILRSADASPSGYRVRSAPEASARNSRRREIASWMRVAMIGERMMNTIPTIANTLLPLLSLSLLPPPNHKLLVNISARIETKPTKIATILISKGKWGQVPFLGLPLTFLVGVEDTRQG